MILRIINSKIITLPENPVKCPAISELMGLLPELNQIIETYHMDSILGKSVPITFKGTHEGLFVDHNFCRILG